MVIEDETRTSRDGIVSLDDGDFDLREMI